METTRQNKICRLLQKELSEIFLLQTKSMPGILVSVSAVRIMKSVRYELGTRVRHQLRIIPELKFFVDDSLDYLEKIDELLK